jgi:hypothetical protein
VVKVERQFDYAGEIKLKFAAPMGVTGITADEVTIPAESRGSRPTTWMRQRSHGLGSAVFDVPSGFFERFAVRGEVGGEGPSKPRGAPGAIGGQLPVSQRTRSRRKASRPYGTRLDTHVRATAATSFRMEKERARRQGQR